MGKLNKDNLRKTVYYLKKNGIRNTIYAAAERLQKKETDSYTYTEPSKEVLDRQRETVWENPVSFSILVPVFHTPPHYLQELIESLKAQTYSYFQLLLLDASTDEEKAAVLKALSEGYGDGRIQYYKLTENIGIAENTNAGIPYATGEYIALLDHDDWLTQDALYEMATAIKEAKGRGIELQMLYSDEDKCNGDGSRFYEPHYKMDFDPDLLLTNNYICHFTAVKAELFKELKLRGEYNGAQDFDLVLRVAGRFWNRPEVICHIPKILYHWRCHEASTAANPASKMYAYEAGKKAVENFVAGKGWKASVEHLKHLGFYRVSYKDDIFTQRPDVAAVGGSLISAGKRITGGLCDARGNVIYKGLRKGFSGYMNRAVLTQRAEGLDIRCMRLNPACEEVLQKSLQKQDLTYIKTDDRNVYNKIKEKQADWSAISKIISKDLREAGFVLLWNPEWFEKE